MPHAHAHTHTYIYIYIYIHIFISIVQWTSCTNFLPEIHGRCDLCYHRRFEKEFFCRLGCFHQKWSCGFSQLCGCNGDEAYDISENFVLISFGIWKHCRAPIFDHSYRLTRPTSRVPIHIQEGVSKESLTLTTTTAGSGKAHLTNFPDL